ncbi:hypothetical protein GJ744_004128 [Endocarpon pusillum]|uniref:Uncharacterized protein n=1 Tax=Endocarpon pusillum TaxID=364733 RepID=A0A8H7E7R9_9EURO|nr:hypothetical protein GJ744_004128 [Endocarpon pusillum]
MARLFYSPDKNPDHIDVGYHDRRISRNNKRNMNLGVYHSISRERAQNTQPTGDSSWLGSLDSSSIPGKTENTGGDQKS